MNFYQILGVAEDALIEEIKAAYRRLAKEWHPDKNSAPEALSMMVRINQAFATLSDAAKRSNYDAEHGLGSFRQRPGGVHAEAEKRARAYESKQKKDAENKKKAEEALARAQKKHAEERQKAEEEKKRAAKKVEKTAKKTTKKASEAKHEQSFSMLPAKFTEFFKETFKDFTFGQEAKPHVKQAPLRQFDPSKPCKMCQGAGTLRVADSFKPRRATCPQCGGIGS